MSLLKWMREVSPFRGMPIDDKNNSSIIQTVSGETVQFYYYSGTTRTIDAGQAAGVSVVGVLKSDNIKNQAGTMEGTKNDTSLSFTSTALTTEVLLCPQDLEYLDEVDEKTRLETVTENLSNGEYVVDYSTGTIYGKKASTQTSLTATTYKVKLQSIKDSSIGNESVVQTATGGAAMSVTTAIGAEFKLIKVTCHFSAAPTTAEDFEIKLDANAGAAYDTLLFSETPSEGSATDLVFIPDGEMKFVSGDELVVSFTNTDTVTYGLSIYYELI